MKAALLYEHNKPLRIEDVDSPKIGPWDALVRVKACGICGSDLHIIEGKVPGYPRKFPIILGHEAAGEIAAVGQEVRDLVEGDRVALCYYNNTCGNCRFCRTGRENLCSKFVRLGIDVDGSFAEYVRAQASYLLRLPKELSYEEGAALTDAVATPYHAVVKLGKVGVGDDVAIIGVGGVGMSAVQLAKLSGARKVIAVDISEQNLDWARSFGADETVNAREGDPVKRVFEITGGVGVDAAFEVVGLPQTMEQAFNCVKTGGRMVIVGVTSELLSFSPRRMQFNEIRMMGSKAFTRTDIADVIELARTGRIKVKPLITSTISLDEINDGIDRLKKRVPNIRTIIKP